MTGRVILAVVAAAALSGAAARAAAQEIPTGRIVDEVKCAAEPDQSYALYLPSNYTPTRQWSVLFAFHPAARGRDMVAKYAAAAEQYGYIVAGSNNSRNGPWSMAAGAIRAMPADVGHRFSIDPTRVYLTGMSGGARVAFQVALAGTIVAGVIASSAGLPDSRPRARVPFPVFATAGTEDFNYLELRLLDRKLTTPHRLVIFEGGHGLPPDGVAMDAIEWMEVQAMKTGLRARDEALIGRLLDKRRAAIAASSSQTGTVEALESLAADFEGLRDVSAESARARDLRKQPDVKKALDRERSAEHAEERALTGLLELEADLQNGDTRMEALARLRDELARLSKAAGAPDDSPARSQARRILRLMTGGAPQRVTDREYLAILEQYRLPGGPRGR